MSTPSFIIDLSKYTNDKSFNTDMIQDLIPCASVDVQSLPGAPESPSHCPGSPKYSGETVTLQATPDDGIGPYKVEFFKNDITISTSRLTGTGPTGSTGTNPIYNVTERDTVIRVYTLDDIDVSSALTGSIDFSVYVSDSCPTSPMGCNSTCTVALGCVAPVCNFTVT